MVTMIMNVNDAITILMHPVLFLCLASKNHKSKSYLSLALLLQP